MTRAGGEDMDSRREDAARSGRTALPRPADRSAFDACLPESLIPFELRERVLSRYDEPHRFYHGRSHVLELFECARRHRQALSAEQSLALLYHDAVYRVGAASGENERRSAELARADARLLASGVDLECVVQIIEDTGQHLPARRESELVLDLDLSPLAAAPDRFRACNELIWLENRRLFEGEADPRAVFDQKRAAFLAALAGRKTLFSVLTVLEPQARENIANLLKRP